MYIERDSRRQTPREGKAPENNGSESVEYLMQCLDLLINHMVDVVPRLFSKNHNSSVLYTDTKSFYIQVSKNLRVHNCGWLIDITVMDFNTIMY